MLMPRGGIFAMLPACYYVAVYFMPLTAMSQWGTYPRERDHAAMSNTIAISICCVQLKPLTELFLQSFFRDTMMAARNDSYQSNFIFITKA